MKLQEIDRVDEISAKDFINKYVKTNKPVVIKNLSHDWPAYQKWSLDYFAKEAGEVEVPLYNSEPAKGKEYSRKPATKMKMKDYVEILKSGPTDLRIFFFNILQKCPQLLKDFTYPAIGLKFFKKLPVLFFGGEGSRVLLHYDIDLANNVHFNFHGKKDIILFPFDQRKYLYHVPYSIVSMEEIEFDRPDYKKYPALQYAEGYRVILQPGETLFIPSAYWHYMRYLTPSISMTLRAFPTSLKKRLKLIKNVVFMMNYDNLMRKLRGQKWIDYKNKITVENTNKNI